MMGLRDQLQWATSAQACASYPCPRLPLPALIRKLVQSKQILTTSFIDEPEMQSQRTLRNDWHMLENKISLKQAQSASWGPEVWFSHRWEEARRGDLIQENNLISQALPTCFTNYLCSWGLIKFSKWVFWCKLLLKNLINSNEEPFQTEALRGEKLAPLVLIGFYYCDNTLWPNATWGRKGLFRHTTQVIGSQERNSRQESRDRNRTAGHGGMWVTGCSPSFAQLADPTPYLISQYQMSLIESLKDSETSQAIIICTVLSILF